MFLTPRETLSSYDLCIIGAGPIGITIAAELAYSGLKICVLESGAQARTVFADALKSVESEGIPVTPVSRERVVGGSTATWGALSAPLDTVSVTLKVLEKQIPGLDFHWTHRSQPAGQRQATKIYHAR